MICKVDCCISNLKLWSIKCSAKTSAVFSEFWEYETVILVETQKYKQTKKL